MSANPTGPLAVVNGRAAALGDALASLFGRIGWDVSREYYVNDALNGTQVQRFAETLEERAISSSSAARWWCRRTAMSGTTWSRWPKSW